MYWMDERGWGPFGEFRALQREMNRLFEGYGTNRSLARFPALNVWGNADAVIVTAELPGLASEDIEIDVVGNQLTIKGERKDDPPAETAVCHRREREAGRFVRSLRLPYAVESDQVGARYENGVLTITLPRQEATKPKRIEIKTV